MRVLVADDNPVATVFAMLLNFNGHTARHTISARKTIEVTTVFHPDVVLLDTAMPGVWTALRFLRSLSGLTVFGLFPFQPPPDEVTPFDRWYVRPLGIKVFCQALLAVDPPTCLDPPPPRTTLVRLHEPLTEETT